MSISHVFRLTKKHDERTGYILSRCSLFALCFSCLYFILLLWGYIYFKEDYTGFSLTTGVAVLICFFSAYIANYKKYTDLSLTIISTTILTICTLAGICWGFDLPSVLLGYILSIVIVTTVGTYRQNNIHLLGVMLMMYIGYTYRNRVGITQTWHTDVFTLNDIIEIYIIFCIITALLIFSQRTQTKLLTRAKRTEYFLQQEKDLLETRIAEKITEVKSIQMEYISTLYRFVEFGKISSGLFHDLMSPIQTLKLYIESFPHAKEDKKPFIQIQKMQQVSTKIEHMLKAMRKQIRFNQHVENFDVCKEIEDILLITKHLHITHNVSMQVICDTKDLYITTKRTVLNHVLLNIISNAIEACISRPIGQRVQIYVGKTNIDAYKTYISVVDTGKGISRENLSKIFDQFYSTKNTDTNEQSNCGIGLASSKYAVERYLQGKLLVESEENVGTTMTILF